MNPYHDKQGRFDDGPGGGGGGGRIRGTGGYTTKSGEHIPFKSFAEAGHEERMRRAGQPVEAAQPRATPLRYQVAAQEARNRHGYNAAAVNQAIASNNRHGPKIGGREATLIHRLLKGR